MFSQLGPIDIECDAPLYPIVEACGKVGFQSPLDVRWCRMSHFREGQHESGSGFRLMKWLFGRSQPRKTTCTCGQLLPLMRSCICTFESGDVGHYFLGQCRRCRTMFWEEVFAPSRKETESGAGGT